MGVVALDGQLREILSEQIADDTQRQIRFGVESFGGLARFHLLLDDLPLGLETVDIAHQFLGSHPFSSSAHDHGFAVTDQFAEDLPQSGAFHVRKFAGDPGQVAARGIHDVATRQGNVPGQTGTLRPNGILGDLHEHRLPGLEHLLHLAVLGGDTIGVPVHFTRVEDSVAPPPDVNERRLHAGKHVLHAPQIDIANQGCGGRAIHIMFDEDPILDHGELGVVLSLTDHEFPVHGFTTRQEFGLGEDRGAATTRSAVLLTALPFGFHAGGTLDPGHLVPSSTFRFGAAGTTATAATAAGAGRLLSASLGTLLLSGGFVFLVGFLTGLVGG